MYLFFNIVTAFVNAQFTAIREIKLTYVGFRAHVKIASRISLSYRISESFDACKKKSPECFFIHFLSSSPVENLSMEVLLQIWKQF